MKNNNNNNNIDLMKYPYTVDKYSLLIYYLSLNSDLYVVQCEQM